MAVDLNFYENSWYQITQFENIFKMIILALLTYVIILTFPSTKTPMFNTRFE